MAGAIPVATMYSPGVAQPGQNRVTVGAGVGVGGIGWPEGAAGGAAQFGIHASANTEVQLSGQAVAHSCDGCAEAVRGGHLSTLGRVGLKWQGAPAGALIGGASYAGFPGGTAVGFDFGGVFDVASWAYMSLRGGAAFPVDVVDSDFDDGEVPTRTTWGTGAFGIHGRSLFLEAGIGLLANSAEERESGLACYLMLGTSL